MLLRHYLSCFCCLLVITFGYSQNRGIILNTPEAFQGYTLAEQGGVGTFLLDNCGEIVHGWGNASNAAYHPKLLPNGNLLFIDRTTGHILELDWGGSTVNNIGISDPTIRLTYEIVLLPNQNYLCVGRQGMSTNDFLALGYNLPGSNPSQGDVVVEVNRNTGDIEWMWRIFDHVIQDGDSSAPNYGVVGDNPQLLDMAEISLYDWQSTESFMINGMDYNPSLDQIALSVRKMCEVVIIDHSTTTAEAAGSTGGEMGKGGDLLYRFGNPKNYDRGTDADQVLYYQHNPKWILEGVHAGKMTCFNNGLNNTNIPWEDRYSSVPIFEPEVDANGNYVINAGAAFMPLQAERSYDRLNVGPDFFSGYTSGAQILPNGNIYLTVGGSGRFIEFDKDSGDILWEFRIGSGTSGFLFRTIKYGLDYAAFTGRDLSPNGTIEQPPSSYICDLTSGTDQLASNLDFYYSMESRILTIEAEDYKNLSYSLYSLTGQNILNAPGAATNILPHLQSGIYVVQIVKGHELLTVEKIVIH